MFIKGTRGEARPTGNRYRCKLGIGGKLLGPRVSFLESFPSLPDKKGHLGCLLEIYLPKAPLLGLSESGRWSLGASSKNLPQVVLIIGRAGETAHRAAAPLLAELRSTWDAFIGVQLIRHVWKPSWG